MKHYEKNRTTFDELLQNILPPTKFDDNAVNIAKKEAAQVLDIRNDLKMMSRIEIIIVEIE